MSLRYRADIDGLRAIAIGLVVVFHFDILSLGQAGFIGVDVFFVISGFLITGIIAGDLAAGRFRFADFLYRRVRRLYPALLATLLLFGAFAFARFLPPLFAEVGRETFLSLLYVVNVYFWRSVDYFGLHVDSTPLLHTWSLAVEEQFYLLFPPVCLLVHRLWPHRLRATVIGLGLASFALSLVASGWKPQAAFYLTPTRAWELMLGSALALSLPGRRLPAPVLRLAGPLGLGLIALALVIYTPALALPGWFALLPTLGAAALILGGLDPAAPVTRLMALRPMVWLGRISYPLYLVHWPIWIALQDQLPEVPRGLRVAGLGLSVLCAWAIYALVETPVRQGRVLARPRAFLAVAGTLSLGLMAASAVVVRSGGLPGRFPPEVQRLLAVARDVPRGFEHCEYRGGAQVQPCRIGTPGVAPSVLLIGDSHARALAGAFDLYLRQTGKAGLFGFSSGCLPVPGAESDICSRFVAAALQRAAEPDIAEVVFESIWRQPYEGTGMLFDGAWVPHAEAGAVFADRLTRMTAALTAAGKRVVLIEPLYAAPHRVPDTLARNLAFGQHWPVDTPYAAYRATFAPLFSAFGQAAAAGARRVSLIGELCRSGTCPGTWEGRPVFSDNNHLAFGMSSYMAGVLERQMP